MKKKKKLNDGIGKSVYATTESEKLIQEFMDDAIPMDGSQKTRIKGKGIINNRMSAHLFEYLEGFNVPTHFIKTIGDREMLVRELKMIPVEIFVRNIASDMFFQKYGIEKGTELKCPVTEYYFKNEEHKELMINQSHFIALGLATNDELKMIERLASKINAVLKSFFMRRQIKLVDFKLEFGRYKEKIVLGDEITADTCRFWDSSSGDPLDNDVFALSKSNIENAFQEIESRILT